MPGVTATDGYEVTMALSYLREGMRRPATFSLFGRDLPESRGFLVAAGPEPALDSSPAPRSPGPTCGTSRRHCTRGAG